VRKKRGYREEVKRKQTGEISGRYESKAREIRETKNAAGNILLISDVPPFLGGRR